MSESRFDYWFPLAALGFSFLLITMAEVPAWPPARPDFGWYGFTRFSVDAESVTPPSSPEPVITAVARAEAPSEPVSMLASAFDEDLAALPLLGFVLSLAFYAAASRSRGRPVAPGRYALVGVLGAVEIVLVASVLERARALFGDGRFAFALCLPLLVLGLLCAVLAVFLRGVWRHVVVGLAGVAAVLIVCAVTVPVVAGSTRVLLVTAGLSVLVWWHRSVLLAVVTAVFLLSALYSAGGPLPLVPPATVLLAGAVAALVLRHRPLDRAWTMNR